MYLCKLTSNDALKNADVLSLSGCSSLQDGFSYELLIKGHTGSSKELLGSDLSIELEPEKGMHDSVFIHGYISHAQLQSVKNKTVLIRVEPSLKKLDDFYRSNITHPDDLEQLIDSVLREHQFNNDDFSFALQHADKLPAFDCFVQYQESDYQLIKRWCEWAGWCIHYSHNDKGCTITFSDSNQNFATWPDGAIPIVRNDDDSNDHLCINNARLRRSRRPATVRVQAYDWREPDKTLQSESEPLSGPGAVGAIQLSQQRYRDNQQGEYISTIRSEMYALQSEVLTAKMTHPQLVTGTVITSNGEAALSKEWLINEQQLELTRDESNTQSIQISITATPFAQNWRPRQISDKPLVAGGIHGQIHAIQETAKTSQGQVDLDALGRYAVTMPYAQNPDEPIIHKRMRAVSMSAGAQAGWSQIFPADTEVLVSHINGDADRPVILGSLSNRNSPSPVTNKNATESAWKSPSGHKTVFNDDKQTPQMLKSDASGSSLDFFGSRDATSNNSSDSSFSNTTSLNFSSAFSSTKITDDDTTGNSINTSSFWDASDTVWPEGWSSSNLVQQLQQATDGTIFENVSQEALDAGGYTEISSVYPLVEADLKKAYQSNLDLDWTTNPSKFGLETHLWNAHNEADNFYGAGVTPSNLKGLYARKEPIRVVGGDFVGQQYGTNYTWHEGDKVTWKHGNNVVINEGEPHTFDLYYNKAHVVNLGDDVTVTYDSGGPNWDETYSRNQMDVILKDRERSTIKKQWEYEFGIGKADLEVELIAAECRLGDNMTEMQFKLGGKWEYDLKLASLEFKLFKNDIYLTHKKFAGFKGYTNAAGAFDESVLNQKKRTRSGSGASFNWEELRALYLDVALMQTLNALNRKVESKLILNLYGACLRLIVSNKLDFYFAPIIVNTGSLVDASAATGDTQLMLFSFNAP